MYGECCGSDVEVYEMMIVINDDNDIDNDDKLTDVTIIYDQD